jgi:hypothetical protein
MSERKWTWPMVRREIRRALGAMLLSWIKSIWPQETPSDIAVHRKIGEMARAMAPELFGGEQ